MGPPRIERSSGPTRISVPPRTWPGCSALRWCSWWTRRGPGVRWPRWRPASPASTRGLRVDGVILNRVASDRHERLLREALAASGMPVYGAIRRTEGIVTPSRHLGLIPAAEREAVAGQAIDRMGALIAGSCDLDALLALAGRAPALTGPPWEPPGVTRLARARTGRRRGRRGSLHVRLHRAGRTARGGRVAGGPVRPAAGRGPARGDRRADPRRRLPRGARGRAVRQRAAARAGGRAGPPRRAGRRRMRGAALPGADPGRAAHVRRPRRAGHDDPEADPRLPARRGRDGFGAGPGRRRGARPRVPPHRDRPGPRGPACLAVRLRSARRPRHRRSGVASYLHTHWAGHPAAAARFTAACGTLRK